MGKEPVAVILGKEARADGGQTAEKGSLGIKNGQTHQKKVDFCELLYAIAPQMEASYTVKVQVIRSKRQPLRYYVALPLPVAAAIGLQGGEEVQWELLSREELHLLRPNAAPPRARRRATTAS